MAAAIYNLTIPRGADVNFTLRICDAVQDPVSFDGLTAFYAEIREGPNRPLAASFQFQTNNGWGPLDADVALADGQVKFLLPRANSVNLEVGRKYEWDFFFTDSAGTVDKLLEGSVEVTPSITSVPIL